MALTFICGFELPGPTSSGCPEAFSSVTPNSGSIHLLSTPTQSGNYALRYAATGNSTTVVTFRKRAIAGNFVNIASSFSFYFRLGTALDAEMVLAAAGTTAAGTTLKLLANSTLRIGDSSSDSGVLSTNAFSVDGIFHLIEVVASGTTRTVYVDGVQWAERTGAGTASAQSTFTMCQETGVVGSGIYYIDSLRLYDSSFTPTGVQYYQKLLIPTAGNNANSWVNGGGGTGNISGAVDNIPPIGAAASTDGTKIKNAASGSDLDYTATMQSYATGGIPSNSVVNAVVAMCNNGEEVSTNQKAGGLWIASNPTQSAAVDTFDYGNDAGALATYPTNWSTNFGVVAEAPSVTLATAPTVTVRKVGSTTRVVDVDFMGLYVDYTPPSADVFMSNTSIPQHYILSIVNQ